MKETSLSVRIAEDLEQELEEFIKDEDLDKSVAVRKLLSKSLKYWREEKSIELLSQGKLSFSAAAKFADLDIWSFADKLRQSKTVWIKDKEMVQKDIEKALKVK